MWAGGRQAGDGNQNCVSIAHDSDSLLKVFLRARINPFDERFGFWLSMIGTRNKKIITQLFSRIY